MICLKYVVQFEAFVVDAKDELLILVLLRAYERGVLGPGGKRHVRPVQHLATKLRLTAAHWRRISAYVTVAGAVLLARQVIDLHQRRSGHCRVGDRRRQRAQRPILHVVFEPAEQVGKLAQKGLHESDEFGSRHHLAIEQCQTLEEVVVNLLGTQGLFELFEEGGLVERNGIALLSHWLSVAGASGSSNDAATVVLRPERLWFEIVLR